MQALCKVAMRCARSLRVAVSHGNACAVSNNASRQEMDEQAVDIPSLSAPAKSQSPNVKDALATQSTQAEPASVDELKAALIQVHVTSLMLLSRFSVAHLSPRQADGLCLVMLPFSEYLAKVLQCRNV